MSDGEKLSQNGEELPNKFDTLQVGIMLHDPETGTILDANQQLESIYGYSAETLHEMQFEEFSANTYSYTQTEADRRIAAAAQGTPQSFEWRIKRADGELIWVNINLTRIEIKGHPYVLGEVSDITEYKHNDRRVSLFYRLLRHNLRNDINIITGFASHIKNISEIETVSSAAKKIATAAINLNRVSESVKQIENTITHNRSSWRRRPAVDVITETVQDFEPSEAANYIEIDEQAEMLITVDNTFGYALTHAIENAIVHSQQPDPFVRIIVGESPNTGRAEIQIEDQCPPIPEMEIRAINEHSETTPTFHGSGVGLFVMKWCIESLGGELKIERQTKQHGNCVYFYLPSKESLGVNNFEEFGNLGTDAESETVIDTTQPSTDSGSLQRSTE